MVQQQQLVSFLLWSFSIVCLWKISWKIVCTTNAESQLTNKTTINAHAFLCFFFVFFSLWFLFVFAATVSAEFLKTKQNKTETSTVVVARAVIYNFAVVGSFYLFFFLSLRKESKLLLFGLQATKTARIFFQEKMEGVGKEFKN